MKVCNHLLGKYLLFLTPYRSIQGDVELKPLARRQNICESRLGWLNQMPLWKRGIMQLIV